MTVTAQPLGKLVEEYTSLIVQDQRLLHINEKIKQFIKERNRDDKGEECLLLNFISSE